MIRGSETASFISIRRAPGSEAHPGVERISRDEKVVDGAAALNVALGPPRPLRIHAPFPRAVVGGIRVDEQAGGAAPLSGERLEAAIAVWHRVANERDPSADVDSAGRERVIVGRIAAARIDDGRGDISRRGVRVVGDAGLLLRDLCVLVPVDRIFAHGRAPGDGRRHFHTHFDRVGQQDLVRRDLDLLEPIRRELISRPFGELAITWSAGKMRQGREMFVEGADPFGG